jgi:hypothetical protein
MNIIVKHDEPAKMFLVEIEGKIAKLSYKKINDKTLDYYSRHLSKPHIVSS